MLKREPSLNSVGSDGNTSFLRAARAGHLDKVLEHLKSNIDINTSNANGLNALHLASKDGHVDVVAELLKRGAVVDAATKKGNTALHIASLAGQEEVVKLLVQHGASVNVQSQNGFTPLYMAAQENHDNVVKYLLSNGANQSLATEDGFTPLAVAMQQGHDKVVTVLLENDTRGKNEHNPDVTSKSGFTPLHIASHYGNEAIANLLIHKGADVNYAAKHNITPLHVAAKWGKTNMVALLLENGANIESKTRDGLTPLHCAARSGHEQVVDMLLERGAPISCKTKNGLAPLHMAAQGDHVDAARILLYHRAPVDEVTVDYLTALHVAAHCGHVRVAKLLLDRQADANARALNGFTPLHIACKKNRIKVVELLLKHGASIGATTESGLTPLHVASFMGCMNIVIYLLQHEANPDVPTVRGETPLHLAARANQTDIIRILLRNGAQVDARAREQQTPLHIASRLGNVDIVMLLLQHGAKVDTTTKDMYTALHIAAKEGQDEVAAVLIENGASLNATTKKGFTPLHLAAKYGNIKVAKLLLQKEAPVDAQGKNGVTPLHVASHYDHQNVALLLLDKGASPHAIAKNGHTPLHIAARKNQMDIANTLLEYGAKPNAESKAGFTPLHLSAQEGHTDMSSLLIEHEANTNHPAKNGLTPLHLCAQEDRVPVAEILVKNGSQVDAATKSGFTPLHIASHYGQTNMVKFLLANGANVGAQTSLHYTPLHQAAQQGHTNIVNILLENSAHPNSVTLQGQTPLNIAQKLGYISVIETLKVVTETTTTTTTTMTVEEKYKVVAPEAMQETFMSDSEEEGGEDTVLGDHSYRYLTADEMKSLGDDSLPIDVTRDERIDSNKMVTSEEQNALPPQAIEDGMSPQYITENYVEYTRKYTPDNVDIARHPINIGFLVSFLVDARGGAMRGCRHSGVRVIVPPRCAPSPTRITCRYVRPQRTPHPPPLMEGEALASRVLELGPVGAKFLGPVIIEVPHFAALRGKEREIVILRSDNGETWREHTVDASEDILNDVLNDSFEAEDLNQLEDVSSGRITRVITHDFPQYFAIVTRIRQEVHAIGPEGGMVSSTVVPQVQAVFPQGALTKKIKVGLQAQPIDPELTAKLLGHGVAVSPVVTVEPRRRKFHKAITLSMPAPRAHSQGMINQYSGNAPTLRLLCSITGGTTRAQWEDVTGSTPLTFVNDCVSFTTTVSARFWLMDCRNIGDATKMATELYKEAIHVPFMAKFVVFAKRIDPLEARLRVFCMTDDKEDKTLEHQEHFTEVAKSRDVEVLEGKPQYIEFAGNLVPITKSGEPLQFSFRAFRENRLPFSVRVKDQHAEAVGRCLFMREPKVAKGEPPQQPICILNIVLPDDIVTETVTLTDNDTLKRHVFLKDNFEYYRPDPRLADMSNLLGEDWVPLATQLGLTPSEINVIKSEYPDSVAKQAQSMLRMWISQSGNKAQGDALENALSRIGREDIIPQCLNVDDVDRIPRIPKDVMYRYQKDIDSVLETTPVIQRETYESKYSAEEKVVEEPSDEEDFNKSVSERRQQIEKRLMENNIPASVQRQEIVEEITSIKRQSIVEDKIAEVEVKHKPEQPKTTTIIKTVTTDVPETKKTVAETVETTKTTTRSDYQPTEVTVKKQFMEEEQPDRKTTVRTIITEKRTTEHIPSNEIPLHANVLADRRDSDLLEGVTQRLETTKKVTPRISAMDDPNSPKFSKTPPPSPADFIFKEQAAAIQGWSAPDGESKDKPTTTVAKQGAAMQGIPTSTAKHLASSEELSLDSPKLERPNENDVETIAQQTNAFIDIESRRDPDSELQTVSRESRLVAQDEKTNTLSRDSSREDTSRGDDKKSKKGFFDTLKSFVGKSQDRSDSESEKSQKKEKKKEKRKDKKKKPKLLHEKPPPLEPPERPPRKPKLPTPPPTPIEHPEFENIPYVEASPTDQVNGISEERDLQITDLDAMNEIPEHVKSVANNLVTDIITASETKAQNILEKSPAGKQIIIREELQKKMEPKIYDAGDFRVVISPITEAKSKDFFKAEIDQKQVGKNASEVPERIATEFADVPVRPQRRKEHIYEDIGEPTHPSTKLILYDAEPAPDIKALTTQLIQNEMNFTGWADDRYNIYKQSGIQDKAHTLPKTSRKHGKLFGFLAKKSSKDVDESDNEKEIIEKQDREPSKERTAKADYLSDEEGVDYKKGGFFSIFGKKSKKEEETTDKKEAEIRISASITEATGREISPEKMQVESKIVEVNETVMKTDEEGVTVLTEKTDASSEPKPKTRKKTKKEKVPSESEDESEHKKGGLFGLFSKRGKKDSREEPPKEIQLSETALQDMNSTNDFLQNEVKNFEDVKQISPKSDEDKVPVKSESVKLETSEKYIVTELKPSEDDKLLVTAHEKVKTPTRTKQKKDRLEKRESSVSEDESEGRKSGLFGLFGKKHKKDKIRDKSPKIPDEIKISEDVQKQIMDTNDFLHKEVELFDDVKPVNGFTTRVSDEPLIEKEQITLKDIKKKIPESMMNKDTKIEHVLIKETAKLDPITKEEVVTSATEIIRETVITQSMIKEPVVTKMVKTDPLQEKHRFVKETTVLCVDEKPVEIIKKSFEEPLVKEFEDKTKLTLTTTNFLQGEIDRFDDVKIKATEPVIVKEQAVVKSKHLQIGTEKPETGETVSQVDKNENKKEKQESETDDESSFSFFGLFGKKMKKDDINDKKEETDIPPVILPVILSEEAIQNMSNSDQFLTSEISHFEDVAPVSQEVEEKHEKVVIERQIPKFLTKEAIKYELTTEQAEQHQIKENLKPDIKDVPKESALKANKRKEKIKEKIKPEAQSQENFEKEKKGFFDLFGKKSKKNDKAKQQEGPVIKDIKLSDEVLNNMKFSNEFLINEVSNFNDVRPIIVSVKEEIVEIVDREPFVEVILQTSEKSANETTLTMAQSENFLKDEIKYFDDVKIVQTPEEIKLDDVKVSSEEVKKEDVRTTDKKKTKKDKSDADETETQKKGGFFGLFSKKLKKEEKSTGKTEPSQEALKNMADANQFLVNEVTYFEDVRPEIKKKISKPFLVKTEITKDEVILPKSESEDNLVKIQQTGSFLKEEIEKFEDVKQILPKSPKLKPTHIIKETVIVREDLLSDDLQSILNDRDQIIEEKIVKQHVTVDDKKEYKPVIIQGQEEQKKGGFLGLFGKKQKKEDKQQDESEISEEFRKNIANCNEFLTTEVGVFDDVRPIIKEAVERKDVRENTDEVVKAQMIHTADFLKDEIDNFDDVKQILQKPMKNEEKSILKPTHLIKETIIIRGNVAQEDIEKILDQTDNIKEDIIVKQPTPLDKEADENKSKVSAKKTEGKGKGGFLGLFGKKSKKDVKEPEEKQSAEALKDIQICNQFLVDEVTAFEDVRPIIKKQLSEDPIQKVKKPIAKAQKPTDEDENTKIEMLQSAVFLKDEIEQYDDVRPLSPKAPEKEKSQPKPTHIIKETIVVRGDLPDEELKNILDESDHVKDIDAKKETVLSTQKPKESADEQDEEKKIGFFGLFSKKSKKHPEEQSSEETIRTIDNCNQFLMNEVTLFDDVRPITKEDAIEISDVKRKIQETESLLEQREDPEIGILQSAEFLKGEVDQYYDVKQLLPKSPEKEKIRLKPTHIIKETIVIRSDVPDEEIKSILDENDQIKEDKTVKTKTESFTKKPKEESKGGVEGSDDERKIGFFGIFTKKAKKYEKQPEEQSSEAILTIQNCNQFLANEITLFDDVRPIIKKDGIELRDVKCKVKESESSLKQSEDLKIKMLQSADFLKDKVEQYHDVKQPLSKSPENKEPQLKSADLPDDDIKVILDDSNEVRKDTLIKQESAAQDKNKSKEQSKGSSEESDDKKMGGFFGLFSKKTKKDDKQIEGQPSEEGAKAIQNCDQFLITEIASFEDVRPIIKKQFSPVDSSITDISKMQIENTNDENKITTAKTTEFLKYEIERFDDVKPILPKSPIKEDKSTLKPTHLIKETIIVRGDLPEDEIKKILKENDQVKEDISVNQDTLKKKKPKEKKAFNEESEEKKRGTLLGLFGKKSKRDETELEEQPPEEALKSIQDSHQCVTTEIIDVEDVKPIFKKESLEKEGTTDQNLQTKIKIEQTCNFLKDEIERYNDVKQILPKSPEIQMLKTESSYVMTEKVGIEENLPGKHDIKKADQAKEDEIVAQKVSLDKKKSKKESKGTIEETDEKKKGGFFGLFGKKSKKEEKQVQDKPSDEAPKTIQNCGQFLSNEIAAFEDVRPIIDKTKLEKSEIRTEKLEDQSEKDKIKMTGTAYFLKNEVEGFEDVKQIPKPQEKSVDEKLKPTHIIKETIIMRGDLPDDEIKRILDDSDQIKEDMTIKERILNDQKELIEEIEDMQHSRQTPTIEHIQNVTNTDNFLSNEIKYFEDVRPIPSHVSEESRVLEGSPKKTKKKKKSKRESSESGDESDGSKKSGFFKLFGKKTKKDKSEIKDGKVSEEIVIEESKSMSSTLESPKKIISSDEKSKPERKGSQKKSKKDKSEEESKSKSSTLESPKKAISTEEKQKNERKDCQKKSKKDKSEEDNSKYLFGIFGKKDKTIADTSSQTDKIILSETALKNMKDSSNFLANEIDLFDDVMEVREPVIKSNVNLDGKMTIAEISKTLIPKTYESGEFQIVVSSTSEPKKREFLVTKCEPIDITDEKLTKTSSGALTLTEEGLVIDDTQIIPGYQLENKISTMKKQSKKQTSPEVELSQDVLKSMIDTSNFLNQEVSRFQDVKPVIHQQESSLSEEEPKERSKRKKKQKSIEEDVSRISGFFGLFGKRDKKSESPENTADDKKKESEQVKEHEAPSDEVKLTQKTDTSQELTASKDFVESVHLTSNFLNDEIKNYHDVKPFSQEQQLESTSIVITSQEKHDRPYTDIDQKTKSKSLFGIFGKKSEEVIEEQQIKKDATMKEKRERRKSGSPFRLFSKKPKEDENVVETRLIISEQALQDMYETKNFLSTEVMRYSDAPLKSEDKQTVEIKKSVAFIDGAECQTSTIASTIAKESLDDGKIQIEAIFKEIRDDLQPAEKVIVVIKDDVTDATKSVKEMSFSPPDIISEITANIPSDSTIKEIQIETIEIDANLTQPHIEELINDSKETVVQTKTVSNTIQPIGEAIYKLEEFLNTERSFTNIDVSDQKEISKDIGQQFEKNTNDVLELTKELDSTEILENKASDAKDNLKKETKKSAKISGGFFSKLGEKIGGKVKPTKAVLEDTQEKVPDVLVNVNNDAQSTEVIKAHEQATAIVQGSGVDINDKIIKDMEELEAETSKNLDTIEKEMMQKEQEKIDAANQYLKNKEESIRRFRETTPDKLTEISQIVQSEIEKITRDFQDESRRDTQHTILASDVIEESAEKAKETKSGIKETADKGKTKKPSKKTVGFFGKLGDKLSTKARDIRDEEAGLVEKAEDKLKQVEGDIKIVDTKIEESGQFLSESIQTTGELVREKGDKVLDKTKDKTQKIIDDLEKEEIHLKQNIKQIQDRTKEVDSEVVKDTKQTGEELVDDIVKTVSEGTDQGVKDCEMKIPEDSGTHETRDCIEDLVKSSEKREETNVPKIEVPQTSVTVQVPEIVKKSKKRRRKSGGIFAMIGGIFTEKGGDSTKETDVQMNVTDAAESALEVAKQTSEFFTNLKDAEKVAEEEVEKDSQNTGESTSEMVSSTTKKESVSQVTLGLSEDAKDSASKIDGLFSSFDKKVKDTAVEVTDNVSLKTKEAAEPTKNAATDITKDTGNILSDAGEAAKKYTQSTDFDKKIKTATSNTNNQVMEKSIEKVAFVTQTSEQISQESVEESTNKIKELFGDLGNKVIDLKDDMDDNMKHADAVAESKTKETLEEKPVSDLVIKIGDFNNSKQEAIDLSTSPQLQNDKVEEESKEKIVSLKQTSDDAVQNVAGAVKESTGLFGGIFGGLGKRTKDKKKKVIKSTEKATADLTKETSDFLADLKDKTTDATYKLGDKTIELKSSDELASALVVAKDNAKSATTTEESMQSVEIVTADPSRCANDFLKDLKEETRKKVKDKIKEEGSKSIEEAGVIFSATSEATKDMVKGISEDVKESTIKGANKFDNTIAESTCKSRETIGDLDKNIVDAEDEVRDTFTIMSKLYKDKTEDVKDSNKPVYHDIEEVAYDSTNKIGEFFDDLSKKTGEITKSTQDFLTDARYQATEAMESTSDDMKALGTATSRSISDVKNDAELSLIGPKLTESAKEGVDKIGEYLSGFGKQSKEDTSGNIESVGTVVSDTGKQTTESMEETSTNFGKQTGDFLSNVKDEASDAFKDTNEQIVETKMFEKGQEAITTKSKIIEANVELIKQVSEAISEDDKESKMKRKDKMVGFFGGLGEVAKDVKDVISDKVKSVGTSIGDEAKQTAESMKETTTDYSKQTSVVLSNLKEGASVAVDQINEIEALEKGHETIATLGKQTTEYARDATNDLNEQTRVFLSNLKDEASYVARDADNQFNGVKTEIRKKGEETFATPVNVAEGKMESVKQVGESIAMGAKESVKGGKDKMGSFFGGLSKTAKDITDDISGKMERERDEACDEFKGAEYQMKDVETKIFEKADVKITDITKISDEKEESIKEDSEDAKESVTKSKDKIADLFGGTSEAAKDIKDDTSDKVKRAGVIAVGTVNQTMESTIELSKQTSDFITKLRDEASNATRDTADQISNAKVKTLKEYEEMIATASKATQQKVESVQQDNISEDTKKSKDKIGGFFGDLNKKSEDDTSHKIKSIDTAVEDREKQITKSLKETASDLEQKTRNFLDNLRNEASDAENTATDQIKDAKTITLEKGKETISIASKVADEKIQSTKEAGDDASEGAKEAVIKGKHKIGTFFYNLDEVEKDIKEDTSNKVKDAGAIVADRGKQTKEFLTDSGNKINDACSSAESVAMDKGKTAVETVSEIIKEATYSVKQSGKFLVDDAEEGASKIGGFFGDLGKQAEDDVSDKTKKVAELAHETTTEVKKHADGLQDAFTDLTADTVIGISDITKNAANEIVEKSNDTFTVTSEFLDGSSSKRGSFRKAIDIEAAVTGSAIHSAESIEKDTVKVVKETEDFLSDLKSQSTGTIQEVTDKLQEKPRQTERDIPTITEDARQEVDSVASGFREKTLDTIESTGTVIAEGRKLTECLRDDLSATSAMAWDAAQSSSLGTEDEKIVITEKSKDIKDSLKETSEGISGLFSGFGKKKDKKSKTKGKDLKTTAQISVEKGGYDPRDTERFLLGGRGSLIGETASSIDRTVEIDTKSKSPLVTSPTLPRRVASHRIARDDVPYFVEVTNLTYDDSSSDESYIVTEPAEKFSARISDGSSTDSGQKRRPLFHIESEEDSVSHQGSAKLNVDDSFSERRLETVITDLDDIDDTVPSDTQFTSNILFEVNKTAKSSSEINTDIIEQKLSDIEKALGTLETAKTVESLEIVNPAKADKPSLKRVERKFERMASELMAENITKAKDSNLTSPEIEEKHEHDFHKIVSQLSTEEMSDCQREYAALWDEQTFSPSDGCDTSKTPDSQMEVLELPQGEAYGPPEKSEQQTTPQTFARAESDESTGQRQSSDHDRPIVDQHMLSDEMKRLLKELEEESKK